MAKILKVGLVILLWIMVGGQNVAAKSGFLKTGFYYEGKLSKKVPIGYGKILSTIGNNDLSLTGFFDGNTIESALLKLNETSLAGDFEYNITEDKDTKTATLVLTMMVGQVYPFYTGLPQGFQKYYITITPDTKIELKFECDYSDKSHFIGHITYPSSTYDYSIPIHPNSPELDKDCVDGSDFNAKWVKVNERVNLVANWTATNLITGIKLTGNIDFPTPSSPDYFNDVDSFSITTSDRGIFKSGSSPNQYILTCPNGDVYDGEFSAPDLAPKQGLEFFSAIVKSKASDYVLKNGKITHPDGEYDTYKNGVILSSLKEYRKNSYISGLPKYDDIIQGKIQLTSSNYIKFKAVCADDIYWFAQKHTLDNLDKELYRQSDEYKRDAQRFNEMKQSEFYALGNIANISFNPTNFGVDLSSYYRYKHMPYISEIVIPLNTTGEDADIKINESSLELLQTLKSVRNNLKVLVVMRPDFEYESQYFCKLSAVYLFDSETNTIVYDCSSCIKNTSKAKLLAEDKRQEAKNEAEWRARQKKIRHHSTPKKITCTVCFGQGYVIDSNQVRSRCWNCYGYGYTETYDY
jgi:hypothetical protein